MVQKYANGGYNYLSGKWYENLIKVFNKLSDKKVKKIKKRERNYS